MEINPQNSMQSPPIVGGSENFVESTIQNNYVAHTAAYNTTGVNYGAQYMSPSESQLESPQPSSSATDSAAHNSAQPLQVSNVGFVSFC